MSNNDRMHQKPSSKPPGPSGISPAEFGQFKSRVDRLDKLVETHAVALQEKNTWNSLIREWIGKLVTIETKGTGPVSGELLWVDRYTLCLTCIGGPLDGKKVIVNKSAVTLIYEQG